MAENKELLAKIDNLMVDRFKEQSIDIKIQLAPIKEELNEVKDRLDQLFKVESDDVGAAFKDIIKLNRKVKELERRVHALEN
ncbi:hypothetical protein HY844_00850 [Candidatus Berkelbacteria bacterium]|nr:hypothetical protein [Candidatus Berkelbacteria bacterium]